VCEFVYIEERQRERHHMVIVLKFIKIFLLNKVYLLSCSASSLPHNITVFFEIFSFHLFSNNVRVSSLRFPCVGDTITEM
jgi:hypothetical protein